MREEKFTFISSDGSNLSHGVKWIPDGEVKAVVQIVHGMAEYIERYRDFAEYLNRQGILVVGHDHLGHGASAADESKYGYFAEEKGGLKLVWDVHKVAGIIRKEYEGVPYVLFGHSMGSFVARQYLCMYGEELDAAIICGTGYQPAAVVRIAMGIASLEAKLFGWTYRSKLFGFMTSGSYNLQFKPCRTPVDWLCRDEKVVDAYVEDPRCGFLFTLNGYYNMFGILNKIVNKNYLKQMPKSLPVLFIAGEKDPVGANGTGVKQVVRLFEEYGMQHVDCKLYPEDRHEILNELDKEQVYADVAEWLKKNLIGS